MIKKTEKKEKLKENKDTIEKEEMMPEKKEEHMIKKYEKQLKIALIISAFVILGFIIAYFYAQSLNEFVYAGLDWEHIKYGEVKFYHSRFEVLGGNFYNLYLRNDPRTNDIPVNATYNFTRDILISISYDAASCTGASLPMMELSKFITVMGAQKIDTTFMEKDKANELNLSSADCSDAIDKTVILIQKSDTPKIEQDKNPYCYKIYVGDCKNVEATEKFIVSVIEQINK